MTRTGRPASGPRRGLRLARAALAGVLAIGLVVMVRLSAWQWERGRTRSRRTSRRLGPSGNRARP